MTSRHIMDGIGLLILTGCQSMAGEGMPTLTRTGQVKDVVIQEDLSPRTLTVNPGDEIRWTNKRQGAASVIFLDPVMDTLSCERNFGSLVKKTDRRQYTANLSSNDSASVCFSNGAQVRYVIRAASPEDPGGEINIPGTIRVAGAGEEESRIAADQLRRERDLLQSRSDDLERRLQASRQDREAAEQAAMAARKALAAREQETDRLATALGDAEQAARALKAQLTAEQGKIAALEDDNRTLLSGSTMAQQEIARLQQRAGVLETEAARVKDLHILLSERDHQLDVLRQEAADRQAAETKAALLADEVDMTRQRVAALTTERATLAEESAAVTAERERLAGELTQMRQRLLVEERERTRLEQERQDLTAGLTQAREQLQAEETEIARLEQDRQDLTAGLTQAREQLQAEAAEIARLKEERAAKEAEMARLTRTPEDRTNSLKAQSEKGDIKVRQGRDRLTINMVDRVLFNSGQAQIKPTGLKVLKQVSDVLRNVTDKHIRIEGHTDNVPIGVKLRDKFATNWELSTARATSVVRYLVEEGGVDRRMLEADGYADTRPVVANDTAAGKAANRRIDIVLYPKESAEIALQTP